MTLAPWRVHGEQLCNPQPCFILPLGWPGTPGKVRSPAAPASGTKVAFPLLLCWRDEALGAGAQSTGTSLQTQPGPRRKHCCTNRTVSGSKKDPAPTAWMGIVLQATFPPRAKSCSSRATQLCHAGCQGSQGAGRRRGALSLPMSQPLLLCWFF